MIRLTIALRRRPDLSLSDFQTYWLTTHALLIRHLAPTLAIVGYSQLHSDRNARTPPPFDGLAEVWYESHDARHTAMQAPEALAAGARVAEDERQFVDVKNSPRWWGEAHRIV